VKIFLIGMMGTGKSYWSKQIAELLNCVAYDLDTLIELDAQKTISTIFANDGEDYFRNKEASLLRLFKGKPDFVLATGGGTPCFNDNMRWMNKNGIAIWIDEPVTVLVERLKKEKDHRPLISNLSDEQLYSFLEKKYLERFPFYAVAKYRLTGQDININSFKKIIKENA
jgi:shikimate kinase